MDSVGMRAADWWTARLIVQSQGAYLLRKWEEVHG